MNTEHTTDLDRLHRVVDVSRGLPPSWVPRGFGRTFAACHNLAGIVETCPSGSLIMWPLYKMDWLGHIRPMLSRVLTEHEIEFLWIHSDEMRCQREIRVRFASFRDEDAWLGLRGQRDTYIVDDLGELVAQIRDGSERARWQRFLDRLDAYGGLR